VIEDGGAVQLVDDPALLPPWLPRPGSATVADHVPLELYPEVVRLPFLHDPQDEDPTWPMPLRAEWAALRLCDVLDAPAPFDEGPSGQQLAALLPLLLSEGQRFWFLAADRSDDVELSVRLGRLELPPDRRVRGRRRLPRMVRDLAITASSVSGDAEVSRFWLAKGAGPQEADLALQQLSASHVWTDQWVLRLHAWRYDEQSMLIAGPAGIQQRLAAVGLASWAVAPTVSWPPGCQLGSNRHFGL
jgi:hypothetical protein